MKNKLIGILATLYFFNLILNTSHAQSYKCFTLPNTPCRVVCEDNSNLRSGPSDKYKIICKLKKGSYTKIIDYEDNWYKVQVNNKIGYIKSNCICYEDVLFLDWFEDGHYLMYRDETGKSIDKMFTVEDVKTGKHFNLLRTGGTNHADVEPLTVNDSKQIKCIWHGYNWERRAIYIHIEGKVYGASMSGMPHAGLDKEPTREYTNLNRSDNYGAGVNYDSIKNNGVDGHLDIHLLNSRTHTTNKCDERHQENIKKLLSIHNKSKGS